MILKLGKMHTGSGFPWGTAYFEKQKLIDFLEKPYRNYRFAIVTNIAYDFFQLKSFGININNFITEGYDKNRWVAFIKNKDDIKKIFSELLKNGLQCEQKKMDENVSKIFTEVEFNDD